MIHRSLLALPLLAADTKSEIAKLEETLFTAIKAHDTATLAKFLTDSFQNATLTGTLRDLHAQLAWVKEADAPPADLKIEPVKTTIYGDTVVRINKESYTTSTGAKQLLYRSNVFVKQSGVWKLAFRAATKIDH